MENYPFDATGLGSDELDLFNDTHKALTNKLDVCPTGNIDFHLEQFEVFRGCEEVKLRGSFAIRQANGNNCYTLLLETRTSTMDRQGQRVNRFDCQTWVVVYLKNDFDRVLIRRETLADKIIELVHPVELDFEDDKAFSDTFYVLVNDRNKALRGMDRNFRNAVMDLRHDEFIIEIVGHTLIAGRQGITMPETTVHLAEFAERLCKLC
jgi:hypothetical protein